MTGLLGVALSGAVGFLVWRNALAQRRQEWLQSGKVGLSAALAGDQRLDQVGGGALIFLCGYLDAHAGAFNAQGGGAFLRVSTYGVPSDGGTPQRTRSSGSGSTRSRSSSRVRSPRSGSSTR